MLDGMCLAAISKAPGSRVSWFLMASALYYHADVSLISDGLYDRLAKDLLAEYGTLTHPHAKLFTPDDLRAGTLYAMPLENYPLMTRCAASTLAASSMSRENWERFRRQMMPKVLARVRTRERAAPPPPPTPAAPAPRVRERTRTPPPATPAPVIRHRERTRSPS